MIIKANAWCTVHISQQYLRLFSYTKNWDQKVVIFGSLFFYRLGPCKQGLGRVLKLLL